MPQLSLVDAARRSAPVARKGFVPKNKFHPGGHKGKLHREMGIPEDQPIPKDELRAATHSKDPEKRRDAIRAETMSKWHHGGKRKSRASVLYDKGK